MGFNATSHEGNFNKEILVVRPETREAWGNGGRQSLSFDSHQQICSSRVGVLSDQCDTLDRYQAESGQDRLQWPPRQVNIVDSSRVKPKSSDGGKYVAVLWDDRRILCGLSFCHLSFSRRLRRQTLRLDWAATPQDLTEFNVHAWDRSPLF
uniref:Uncharacterized protein n=1 Tax=Timema douglasi TaxID=61478 RepID=A0A7R8VPC5_TIMDO|nr:unnamed protein product [Timema douglasi]